MKPTLGRHLAAGYSPDVETIDQTRALYDDLAPSYDSHYTSPIHAAEDHTTCRLLQPFVGMTLASYPKPYILDLGCGTGWLLDQFPYLHRSQYLGIDLSQAMVATARAKHPGYVFLQDDIRTLPAILDIPRPKPQPNLIVSTFGTLSHLSAETWVPLLAELAPPGCAYFLTLLTSAALTRRSSLAFAHPHLIHPASAARLSPLLTDHGLPPGKIFGLNPWGDAVPDMLEGKSIDTLANAMLVDAVEPQETSDTHYLLGISGERV